MIYEIMLASTMLFALSMIAATGYEMALAFKQWCKSAARRRLIAKLRREI